MDSILNKWQYDTKTFIIKDNSKFNIDDELNELGKIGWEAYSIVSEPYYDSRLQIGKYKIRTGMSYTVKIKRIVI